MSGILNFKKMKFVHVGESDLIAVGNQLSFGEYVIDMATMWTGYYISELASLSIDYSAFLSGAYGELKNVNSDAESFIFRGAAGASSDDTVRLDGDYTKSLIITRAGTDTVITGAGDDKIVLGDGFFDMAVSGAGDDRLYGGAGMDYLRAQAGNDLIYGGSGRDWISGGDGKDTIYGGDDLDWIDGGAGNDRIMGGEGNDHIKGSKGNDVIFGGSGGDWMKGGPGRDVLVAISDAGTPDQTIDDIETMEFEAGRRWDDTMIGGDDADRFVFKYAMNATEEVLLRNSDESGKINWVPIMRENGEFHDHWVDWGGLDVIEDFSRAEGDKIVLRGHTVGVHSIEYQDTDGDGVMDTSFIHVFSNQAGMMGFSRDDPNAPFMAHDGDYLGRIEVTGELIDMSDIEVFPMDMVTTFSDIDML